jgi:hypothetical protein
MVLPSALSLFLFLLLLGPRPSWSLVFPSFSRFCSVRSSTFLVSQAFSFNALLPSHFPSIMHRYLGHPLGRMSTHDLEHLQHLSFRDPNSFAYFPLFPAEVRSHIWQMSTGGPRVHKVTLTGEGPPPIRSHVHKAVAGSTATCRALLATSKEARAEAEARFPAVILIVRGGRYRGQLRYDPTVDVICLELEDYNALVQIAADEYHSMAQVPLGPGEGIRPKPVTSLALLSGCFFPFLKQKVSYPSSRDMACRSSTLTLEGTKAVMGSGYSLYRGRDDHCTGY